MVIQSATPGDMAAVTALLEACALPVADLTPAHMPHFTVARQGETLAGVVGIEPCGQEALLRSLAVAGPHRGKGLARRLVAAAEEHARSLGVRHLYLLTTSAAAFFVNEGYAITPRSQAPQAIRATREFTDICPKSSVCQSKAL